MPLEMGRRKVLTFEYKETWLITIKKVLFDTPKSLYDDFDRRKPTKVVDGAGIEEFASG